MSVFRWYLCILWCILLSLFVYWIYSWRVFVQQDLKRLSFIYLQLLKTKPLPTKSVTSLFLFFSSDFFAQCMTERTMSWKRMCRFALWGACVGAPLLHFWHSFIELFQPSASHWRALCSVVIDQGFMTPLYTMLFMIYDAVASGSPLRVGIQRARTESYSVIWKTWVFWYPAQFLNLRFIPVDLRVAYINAVNVGWNMYFSYITKSPLSVDKKEPNKDNKEEEEEMHKKTKKRSGNVPLQQITTISTD